MLRYLRLVLPVVGLLVAMEQATVWACGVRCCNASPCGEPCGECEQKMVTKTVIVPECVTEKRTIECTGYKKEEREKKEEPEVPEPARVQLGPDSYLTHVGFDNAFWDGEQMLWSTGRSPGPMPERGCEEAQ